jgi:formylglycine-generating enzyme required for sulfatase activity
MKTKIMALALLLMAFTSLYAQSEDDFEVRQNADNTVTITGYKDSGPRSVVIPETLFGLKVVGISEKAFMKKEITSVVIPNTVINIADGGYTGRGNDYFGAFAYNSKLSKVTFGEGLKIIGSYAFFSTGLTEIIIPNSVIAIGFGTFGQSKLTRVTFGTGLQNINPQAFYRNKIAELDFPSSLKVIGFSAFEENEIQSVTFNAGLQTIGSRAFYDNHIVDLKLPSSIKKIESGTFAKNLIRTVTIPNSVTFIDNYNKDMDTYMGAFAQNPLKTVVIPASLVKGKIEGEFLDKDSPTFGKKVGSTITRIVIPAGMSDGTISGNFEEAFFNFWKNQKKAGGTYVKRGPIWSKEAAGVPAPQDERDTINAQDTAMVFVEGGTFTMGCTSENERECRDDDKPAHSVTVGDFYIAKYEVTQRLWKAVMGSDHKRLRFAGDDLPVQNITWSNIQYFIKKLNELTGKNYRLPTEAEWEYAARGGNKSKGYKYSGSNNIDDVTWRYDDYNQERRPVGTKQPNELGIYDMSGNVSEWVNDWFGGYTADAKTNPQGPESGSERVYRGYPGAIISSRGYDSPIARDGHTGFRLVLPP